MARYQRILVFCSQPFNYLTGFGITASNLFKNWPSDHLACAYTQDLVPADSVCHNHFKIKPGRLRSIVAGRLIISDDFRTWVENFHPEIIYCAPICLSELIYALGLHRLCKAKLVVHMLDDWPSRLKFGNIFLAGITKYYLKRLFKKASLRFGIGKDMCDAYKKRYGLEFLPFQNYPERELWLKNSKSDYGKGGVFRFVFTGAIYNPGNLQTLQQLSKAIDLVNLKGHSAKIEVYAIGSDISKYEKIFIVNKFISFLPLFSSQEIVAKLYGQADGLLLLLGFEKISMVGEKYSMPTKLPAYMLSAAPILVCAPEDSALAKFIKANNAGFIISGIDNIEELADNIIRFISNENDRKKFGVHARDVALQEFSAEVVRPRFTKAITSIK